MVDLERITFSCQMVVDRMGAECLRRFRPEMVAVPNEEWWFTAIVTNTGYRLLLGEPYRHPRNGARQQDVVAPEFLASGTLIRIENKNGASPSGVVVFGLVPREDW